MRLDDRVCGGVVWACVVCAIVALGGCAGTKSRQFGAAPEGEFDRLMAERVYVVQCVFEDSGGGSCSCAVPVGTRRLVGARHGFDERAGTVTLRVVGSDESAAGAAASAEERIVETFYRAGRSAQGEGMKAAVRIIEIRRIDEDWTPVEVDTEVCAAERLPRMLAAGERVEAGSVVYVVGFPSGENPPKSKEEALRLPRRVVRGVARALDRVGGGVAPMTTVFRVEFDGPWTQDFRGASGGPALVWDEERGELVVVGTVVFGSIGEAAGEREEDGAGPMGVVRVMGGRERYEGGEWP